MTEKVNPLCDYCLTGFYLAERSSPVCLNQACPAQSDFARRPEGKALRASDARWMIEPKDFRGPGRLVAPDED